MCKYFWEKNYIDQFLIPPCLPFQSKGKTAPFIFVFRKVLDCKHLKKIKGGWPVHPKLFPGFQSFQQQPSVCRKEGGPVEYKRDRRCLCYYVLNQSSQWPTPSPLLQDAARGKDFRRPAKKRWRLGDAEGDCYREQRTMARSQSSPHSVWNNDMWPFHSKNCSDKHFFSRRKGRDYSLFCLFILVQIKAPWNFCVIPIWSISGRDNWSQELWWPFQESYLCLETPHSHSGLNDQEFLSRKPNKWIQNLDCMPSPNPVSLTALTKWYGMASAPYNIWIVDSLSQRYCRSEKIALAFGPWTMICLRHTDSFSGLLCRTNLNFISIWPQRVR